MPTKGKRSHNRSVSRPTLHDVAKRAGVSVSTVSRCLTVPEKVRPAVRQRVREIIDELGYTPDGTARALVSRRTDTIGAIVPTLDNAIFATVIQTLQHELTLKGKTLLLAASDYQPQREYDQIEKLLSRGIDGLMLTGEVRRPAAYRLLARHDIRYVSTYVHHPDSSHPTIGFDNRRAMDKVVGYLHDLGHRRFAMIVGPTEDNDRATERLLGARNAMQQRGLSLAPERIVEQPYAIAAGRAGLRRLCSGAERPTAVLCGNDVLAFGALFEAAALGLRVPEDVSITGFDDLGLAQEITPSLTTVHAPLAEMGRLTAAYLLDSDPTDSTPIHLELPAELVVRASTGPAPS